MSLTEILTEQAKEEEKYFKNYLAFGRKIKKIVKNLKDARVYFFGSVIEGNYTPASDIDVIIVSRNMPSSLSKRNKIKVKILKEIGIFAPFEIHLANEKEFEWYKRFIKKFKEV
jgi:predicted nucleotidyltransferase